MNEHFDTLLAKKIKDTLESHTESYVPGEWENFKTGHLSGRPGKKRQVFFWLGLAASLLMAFAATFTLTDLTRQPLDAPALSRQVDTRGDARVDVPAGSQTAGNRPDLNLLPETGVVSGENHPLASLQITEERPTAPARPRQPERSADLFAYRFTSTELPLKTLLNPVPARTLKLNVPEITTRSPFSWKDNIRTGSLAFHSDVLAEDEIQRKSTGRKGLTFGLNLTSIFHGRQQQGPPFTVGGGVTAEVPLAKNLELLVGLLAARHQFGVLVNNAPNPDRNLSVDIVSLEMPINLKYTLTPNAATPVYASVGLSSLAYLKESYTYSGDMASQSRSDAINAAPGEPSQLAFSRQAEKESAEAFSRLDMGRQLNLAVGLEYPLQDNLTLVVEPYYKHSLASLTSENIRFSHGGVNLRLNMGKTR